MPTLENSRASLTEAPPQQRPQLTRTSGNRWSIVAAVLLRELKARLLTPGYLWSTVAFAAVAFFTPAALNRGDSESPVIAVAREAGELTSFLESGAQGAWSIREVANTAEAEALVANGDVDAFLTPAVDGGWSLVSATSLDPELQNSLQSLLASVALTDAAAEAGASPDQLAEAASWATVTPVFLEQSADLPSQLFALGVGLVTVFIVVLWGASMAGDVVQEKTTRVVEILLATLRPWQLLAGKILAITTIGILQVSAVILATWAGLELFGDGISLEGIPVEVFVVGVISVVIGVPLLCSFMAAMAARVDHPDDVSTATQPVYLLLMVPFAAVVFLAFEMPNSTVMEVLAYLPVTNIFAMPVFVTVDDIPLWQLLASLTVALLTLVAVIALAGRIYSNSILRTGTIVSFREAVSST
ncbi:ABC-2 type transport system permease protein [Corynebacterium timonense]|uniref:ABC-2 type transport system permease protein n=1 Tax=Corynebacterium timonense TaxID=441500 RepID=A0A1H1S2G4_9CORY|nr:ABC-2 type transport system permease protein [Corynebacterium timonense]